MKSKEEINNEVSWENNYTENPVDVVNNFIDELISQCTIQRHKDTYNKMKLKKNI